MPGLFKIKSKWANELLGLQFLLFVMIFCFLKSPALILSLCLFVMAIVSVLQTKFESRYVTLAGVIKFICLDLSYDLVLVFLAWAVLQIFIPKI